MKKNLLKSLLAIALVSFGCMNVAAQEEENNFPVLPVKMTYVDYYDADTSLGELDTIWVGYTKAPVIDGTIANMKQGTDWNVSKVGFMQVDATAIPGVITKATLKVKVTGCDTGRNRKSSFGVALTDSAWVADMTYNKVSDWPISALLNNNGVQAGSSTGNTEVFEEISFDISDALQGADFTGFATLVVYETAAGGARLTEAYVEVEEYDAYEATTTKYDFEDEVNPFTDRSRVTGAIEADATLNSNVLGWTCAGNAQNGYCFSDFNFTELLNQPALVKVEFDYYNTKGGRSIMTIGDAQVRGTTGGSSKTTYNSTGAIFRIGSDKNNAFINGVNYGQDDRDNTYKIFSEELQDSIEVTETIPGLCNKWMHVTLMVNNDAKTVTWVITDMEGEAMYYGSEPFYASDAISCSQIDMFGYINNSHCAMIDNLEITNYKSNAVFADYTVRYVDANGTDIKESRTGNGQVGKFVKLLDSDKAAIRTDDMKYIYVSDDSETVAIAEEGTVITVTFRNANVYAGVLNCMIDGQSGAAARLASFSGFTFFEGDNYYVYPSRGYGKEGTYYFTDATSWNGVTFTFPGSLNGRTISGVYTYIGQLNYAPVDSVAYYSDFERLALPVEDEGNGTGLGQLVGTVNSWYSFSGGIFDRFSQGRGIRLDADSYVYTEPIAEAGTYKITIYGRNDQSSTNETPYKLGYILDGESFSYNDVEIPAWGSATTGSNIVEGVAIPAGANLMVMYGGGQVSLDDISLTKTGDYVAPVVTAINTIVENVQPATNAIFNLAGQQVRTTQRGLYIINGRKVVK